MVHTDISYEDHVNTKDLSFLCNKANKQLYSNNILQMGSCAVCLLYDALSMVKGTYT